MSDVTRGTVGFTPKAQADIEYLQAEMAMTKADIVNIAVNTFAYLQRRSQEGKEWIARDRATHEAEIVHFSWQLDSEDQRRALAAGGRVDGEEEA